MRVLVVPKWYPTAERPAFGIFCQEHARALSAEHDVCVLASYAVRRAPFLIFSLSESVEDGLRTMRLQYRRPRLRALGMAFQAAGMLCAALRLARGSWRPQIIHAHVYSAGLPAVLLGRLLRVPVVISEHYTGFQRGLITGSDRLTARLAFRGCALLAPVSESLAEEIRPLAPRARITVVGNPVDLDIFHPPEESSPSGSGRLLCVAELTAKKGHAHLLAAVALLSRRENRAPVMLELAGGGELRQKLQREVNALGLQEQVRFHGEVSKLAVAELMRRSDLFILPSLHENLPCVLVESMACGLPFVATGVGGVRELFRSDAVQTCCRLVAPADAGALADAIDRTLGAVGPAERRGLSDWARSQHSYEAIARTWTKLYRELL